MTIRPCTAILIDPSAKTITAVQLVPQASAIAQLADLYKLIGTAELGMSSLANGDVMWYDDNGLLKDWGTQAFFRAPFYPTPLAGKVIVTRYIAGMEHDALADCKTNIKALQQAIEWVTPEAVKVPAPTISKQGADGIWSDPVPLDGGAATWTHANNPGNKAT